MYMRIHARGDGSHLSALHSWPQKGLDTRELEVDFKGIPSAEVLSVVVY